MAYEIMQVDPLDVLLKSWLVKMTDMMDDLLDRIAKALQRRIAVEVRDRPLR